MPERRRDQRIGAELPFVLRDDRGGQWHATTVDLSPTGLRMRLDGPAPAVGTLLRVAVQGPAESDWERINQRAARVVRTDDEAVALTYADLDQLQS